MNDAFRADAFTFAVKAKVEDLFIGMLSADFLVIDSAQE
jgi:hypothetical protein